MAITSSAKKAIRVSKRRAVFNARRKKELNSALKEVEKLIGSGNKKEAEAMLPRVYRAIDKAQKRGVLKANTASRAKSRISKRISSLGQVKSA